MKEQRLSGLWVAVALVASFLFPIGYSLALARVRGVHIHSHSQNWPASARRNASLRGVAHVTVNSFLPQMFGANACHVGVQKRSL
jgi:hypothetical protein